MALTIVDAATVLWVDEKLHAGADPGEKAGVGIHVEGVRPSAGERDRALDVAVAPDVPACAVARGSAGGLGGHAGGRQRRIQVEDDVDEMMICST